MGNHQSSRALAMNGPSLAPQSSSEWLEHTSTDERRCQKKKLDAEERRVKQKKARKEFTKMLEEFFENDERFNAVERHEEREDLFVSYMAELEKKEKAKAQEERKQNLKEFRQYLETCDFIKADSQWRKVEDRLEGDERCLRLEKIDRLLVFQDYRRDLEKEEEEQRKLLKLVLQVFLYAGLVFLFFCLTICLFVVNRSIFN